MKASTRWLLTPAVIASVALSCGGEEAPRTAAARGRELVSDPKLSRSTLNFAACTTCHRFDPSEKPGAILPGATLAGATLRSTFWSGQETDLLRSINQCRFFFMSSNTPWTSNDASAQDVYAFLSSLEGTAGDSLRRSIPLTMPREIADLSPGRAADGTSVYERACKVCHGEAHSGNGRIRASLPILPEETVERHAYLNSRDATRRVFIEKTRHGGFFGYGGSMPPFALEVLPDGDLAALLSYLGLY